MKQEVIDHFKKQDQKIYQKLIYFNDIEIKKSNMPFLDSLIRDIIYQQLHTKAASTIHNRFIELVGSDLTTKKLLKTPIESFRSVGLSNSKANYIHNIAEFFNSNQDHIQDLDFLSDKQVIDLLTQIKGVGIWTVEMFLISTLGREDVFSHGDLGLKKGFEKLYKLPFDNKNEEIIKIIESWSPYKSYASRTLWRVLDTAT